jgi:hypothetical protein
MRFTLAAPEREPTRVVAIHPGAATVPENLLRVYVSFSGPMRRDLAARHVRLLDGDGREVELAFVPVEGGLWDAEGTRLTLIFHPGRLKRGVAPRELLGAPLAAGGRYRLVVDATWPDATGRPLAAGSEREWRVGAADREPVRPRDWTLRPPAVGTRDPLELGFGEPLDQALALRLISVLRGGRPVAGRAELADAEATWRFLPEAPWSDGEHAVEVDAALEDLAGNGVRGRFDRDLGEESRPAELLWLPFRPRSAA